MMTAASIPAASARGYADYLDAKTVAPERGDYYLGPDGSPAEAPGHWLGDPAALARVGVEAGELQPDDLRALMAGRRPGEGEPVWLRAAGPDGSRAGGIDVTFSAPKGVSVAWALGDDRAAIEAAHHVAVEAAVDYLRETADLTVRYDPALGEAVPARAAHLHAAEFMHTTARGVGDGAPDPQLHSHVVVTSVEREDGSVAAVRSRPVMRSAREVGAFYRAHLAEELRQRGYAIEPAGEDGRYFSVGGVDRATERAFSARTEEVERAGREFRALHGRAPERGELRALAVQTRAVKVPRDRGELDRAWRETGRRVGLDRAGLAASRDADVAPTAVDRDGWAERVERNATAKRAVFDAAELRTVALEHAAGAGLAPCDALDAIDGLRQNGRVLDLGDGRMTTARVRAAEQEIERRMGAMAGDRSRSVDVAVIEAGVEVVEARLGAPLSVEQRAAVRSLTALGRAAVLVGPAGTGKGVVIDAAAHAERAAGREVYGVAVAGRTAQRLGESAPALEGRVRTVDGFVAAVEHGELPIDARTTVYVDEAGMGDTERLDKLVRAVDERGGSLVVIGDARQLPSVGAGGMFERLAEQVPAAKLTEVRRAADPGELAAWRELREGDPAAAMAHYRAAGRLHIADTRVEAVEQAARAYDRLAGELGHERVALMSDASNVEIDTLNLRIQALRHERDELTPEAVERADGQRFHGGDRVTWTASMPVADEPRVENGARGTVVGVDAEQAALTVRLDGADRDVAVAGEGVESLRLAYAGHVYRQQGATVGRAVVVTGGWQTSREGAYVQASRARRGVEWHVAREDLDSPDDAARIDALARRMGQTRAQEPSLALPLDAPDRAPGDPIAELHVARLRPPAATPPEPTPAVEIAP
jgi:conjugative relaxase-like TrwC/TraI family protein